MKRWLPEDITAILAIAYGAAISIGITAALFFADPGDGYRSVKVQVNELGMDASVQPGSRVRVTAIHPANTPSAGLAPRVVVKDVEVIAAYRRFSRNVNARPVVVTLMAKRRDAQKLETAATQGELNLVLH